MTVSTTAVPVTYPGDGVTTVFSYPYKFLSTSDIKVYVGGVLKTLTTDYSVGAPSDSGANVTFVTAPGAASGIVFIQDPDSLQSSKLPSNGPFPSSTVERMVDKLTLQVQRLKSLLSRSLTLSDGDSTTASTVLPTPTASSLIGWNSSGNALQNYAGSSSALVSPAMVPVVGASTLALGRAALGAGVIGDALFLTATAAAARAAIGLAAGADIASAATLPLAARTGNLVRVTGVVPVTATDLENGGSCWVIAVGALPLTYHVTNMPLQGGVDHTCQAGDLVIFARDGNGVLHVDVRKFDGTAVAPTIYRGAIDGLTLSTAGASATMSIAAGQATDSSNAVLMSLAALAKTTGAWAVGNANGALDTGAIANNTWYYWFLIRRPDTGVTDVVFSVNSAAPTLPANYTQYRYIGAGLTNGSAQWTKFIQIGDEFWWDTPVRDYGTNGSAAAATLTCTLPRGRKMRGLFHTAVNGGGTGAQLIYLSDLSNADLAPSITIAPLAQTSWNGAANSTVSGQSSVWTNTSAQIRHRELNTELVYIVTLGWTDLRGRNA